MAKELQRTFNKQLKRVELIVQDDLGNPHLLHVQVGKIACPMCARPYPTTSDGKVDLKALVQEICDFMDADAELVISEFERHGADMSAEKQRRAAKPSS